jgi:hypothetical protein
MKVIRPATEEEVLASFAESEFSSPRHREDAASFIDSHTARSRILAIHPSKWSPGDRALAVEAIRKYRASILGSLLKLGPSWYVAEIGPDELPSLLPLDFLPFKVPGAKRGLGTLVEAMDAGWDTPADGFSSGYRRLRGEFRSDDVQGLPGIAAKTEAGPFVVFDGLTRLCVLRSQSVTGESNPNVVPLFLAVSPRLSKETWNWF